MIDIRNVSKRYGRRVALADVSLILRPGEITLLLGANGAGKSTLLRCLLGITDYEGAITVDGLDPLSHGRAVRAAIGYMPQSGGLHADLTVRDTIMLYARIRQSPAERGMTLLQEAGLGQHLETLVGELSGGMRQRLGFALALLPDPRILVLDEPSASLDAASRRWLADRLRAAADEGRIVLVSTHGGQELLDAGDRAITLEAGAVIDVSPVFEGDENDENDGRDSQASSQPSKATQTWRDRIARTWPIALKEVRDALTNRWLIAYSLLLGGLGLAATATGIGTSSGLALQAFGRTTATLMNLCLLLSPLVSVVMGAALIAGEQERGTLEHLLAQPLSRTELLLAKYLGLLGALTAATVAGFVPAGVAIAFAAGPEARYLLFPTIAALAGAAMAAIGLFISVGSRSAVHAQGLAMVTWFAFVLLYDLVLMGSLAVSGVPAHWLSVALVANPVDAARVLGVLALEPDLYLLGPAGAFLTTTLSPAGTAGVLIAALVLWALVPVCAAVMRFSIRKRGQSYEGHKVSSGVVGSRAGRRDRVHVERGVAGVRG